MAERRRTCSRADGTQIAFNSDAGKEAAEFYVGLAQYSPPDFLNSNSWDGRVAFATGQVGMYVAGAWFAGSCMSEFPDINGLWATAPLPQQERCATTIAGDALVMPAQGKNHDAAWKWIEFLSAPQNLVLWNLGTPEHPGTLLPPRKSLLEDPHVFDLQPDPEGLRRADGLRRHQRGAQSRATARSRWRSTTPSAAPSTAKPTPPPRWTRLPRRGRRS